MSRVQEGKQKWKLRIQIFEGSKTTRTGPDVCFRPIQWLIFEKKPKSIKTGNLNSRLSDIITTVLRSIFRHGFSMTPLISNKVHFFTGWRDLPMGI